MPGRRVIFQSLSLTSVVALVGGLLVASAAFAQGPPPEPQLWSAVSTLDILAAARACAADPVCTSYDPPAGLQVDPATGQPLLSVHAKGAMDVGPLLDWAAAHPEVVLVEKLVHVFDMTGFEVDVSMDLLDAEAWTSLRDALELTASTAYVSLHGIPAQAEGIHPDLAAAHGAIQACGGDPFCLQDLHELWPWLDAELAIGALQIEVPHNGDPGQHDAIAAELESLTWTESPWIFAIEPVAGGDHVTRAVGRMPSTQLDGLTAWLAGQPWSARSRPMVEDELSEVRLRLETADAAADVFACDGDVGCHYEVSALHQAVVSPGGRLGVLLHGEDPDIGGLNGLEYPGWSMAPPGYVHDGEAGLLEHQALRELGLGRWNLGEALSVRLDRNPELVGLSFEGWSDAWAEDDTPVTWQLGIPGPGEVLAIDLQGLEHSHDTIQGAVDASGDGWTIVVGTGTYDESIVVASRTGLDVDAYGTVEARGIEVINSTGVAFLDLRIDASGTGQPAITLSGEGSDVQVDRCDVYGADADLPGVRVDTGSRVSVQSSRVFGNGGNGLELPADSTVVQEVSLSIVDGNAHTGIHIKQGGRAVLFGNRVFLNGYYGVEVEPDGEPLEPVLVELEDNTIAMNAGEEIPGQSSRDLGLFGGMFDESDKNNATSRGEELPDLFGVATPNRVWRGILDNDDLAEALPGLSAEAMDALIVNRDAMIAGRTSRASEAQTHHPVLFDIDLGPADPHETTDCYSEVYDFLGVVDYIVDGSQTWPLDANVATSIQDALSLAQAGGDTTGDGEITICVMPGVYNGSIVIDASDFIPVGTPPLRIFGAAGPGPTIVRDLVAGWNGDRAVLVSSPTPTPVWPVFIGGLTLDNFKMTALWANDGVALTLNRVWFTGNSSGEEGGGLRAEGAAVSARYCEFLSNSATGAGGAVFLGPKDGSPGALAFEDGYFHGNSVGAFGNHTDPGTRGGAIAVAEDAGDLEVEGTLFSTNWTLDAPVPFSGGGAIFVQTAAASINSSAFRLNSSAYGGAVALGLEQRHSDSEVLDSTFLENEAVEGGGVWTPAGAQASMGGDVFERNRAERGGAVYGSELMLFSSSFYENGGIYDSDTGDLLETVAEEGGAVYVYGSAGMAPTVVAHATFGENTATYAGGGAFLAKHDEEPGAPATFTHCFFDSNVTAGHGGGLYSASVELLIDALTADGTRVGFVNNHADVGGAVYLAGNSTVVEATWFGGNTAIGENGLGGAIALNDDWHQDPSVSEPILTIGPGWVMDPADPNPDELQLAFTGFGANHSSDAGGALHLAAGETSVDEATFTDNTSDGVGAGVAMEIAKVNDPSIGVAVTGGGFEDNVAVLTGGAIHCSNYGGEGDVANLNVDAAALLSNEATVAGGGISLERDCQVSVVDTTLEQNAAWSGGGMSAGGEWPDIPVVWIESSHFEANTATAWDGGGLEATGDAEIHITGTPDSPSTFQANLAEGDGGGLRARPASVELAHGEFRENRAHWGAGLAGSQNSVVNHIGGGYYGNLARELPTLPPPAPDDGEWGFGGAVWLSNSTGDFTQVEFIENMAPTGAAIYAHAGGDLTLTNTIVAHNHVCNGSVWFSYFICDAWRNLTLDHVTITGNLEEVGFYPGGCDAEDTKGLRVSNSVDYLIEDSVLAYSLGSPQLRVTGGSGAQPIGEIVDSVLFSESGPAFSIEAGTCDQTGVDQVDPLFGGNGGLLPYEPGADYEASYDLHPDYAPPFVVSPLLCATDVADPPAHIGAFGGAGWDWDCSVGCAGYSPPVCPLP